MPSRTGILLAGNPSEPIRIDVFWYHGPSLGAGISMGAGERWRFTDFGAQSEEAWATFAM